MMARGLLDRCLILFGATRPTAVGTSDLAARVAEALPQRGAGDPDRSDPDSYLLGFSQAIFGAYGFSGIAESMKATAQVFEHVFGAGAGELAVEALHRVRTGESGALAARSAGRDDARQLLANVGLRAFALS